jgi:hypothetical protein
MVDIGVYYWLVSLVVSLMIIGYRRGHWILDGNRKRLASVFQKKYDLDGLKPVSVLAVFDVRG